MLFTYTVGLLVTLLPSRLRRRWFAQCEQDLHASAFASGVVQMFACVALLLAGYPRYMQTQIAGLSTLVAAKAAESMGQTAWMTLGGIFGLAYVLQPLSLLLIYFEGVVRWSAVALTGEVIGTLPLCIVDLAVIKLSDKGRERALGPIIPDQVTRAPENEHDFALCIKSCRPKQWTASTTIEVEEQLYEVASEMRCDPPRRFVYLLRPAPLSKVVRGIHHYDPREFLANDRSGDTLAECQLRGS